jgi:hypothetical protein
MRIKTTEHGNNDPRPWALSIIFLIRESGFPSPQIRTLLISFIPLSIKLKANLV